MDLDETSAVLSIAMASRHSQKEQRPPPKDLASFQFMFFLGSAVERKE